MLACDNGQLVGPDGQRAFLRPGVGAAGAGVQGEENGLAAPGEDLEAAECLALDAQAVGGAIEREPLRRCADSDERGWAENALGDVPSGSGGLAVLPVEVDAHHAVGAVGEPDAAGGVKARPGRDLGVGRGAAVEGLPAGDGGALGVHRVAVPVAAGRHQRDCRHPSHRAETRSEAREHRAATAGGSRGRQARARHPWPCAPA